MKKLYLTPTSTSFLIETEGVIASSIVGGPVVNPSDEEHNGEFLSNRGGWSSEDWSDAE